MMKEPTIFMIMPPVDANDAAVQNAPYIEDQLAREFPGYQFQVVDLRTVEPVKPGQRVQFGDGMRFAVIPLVGRTSSGPGDGGYMNPMPSRELLVDITEACERFDLASPRRYVA